MQYKSKQTKGKKETNKRKQTKGNQYKSNKYIYILKVLDFKRNKMHIKIERISLQVTLRDKKTFQSY